MITKTDPFVHQRTAYEMSHGKEFFALLMEMGTGKSWVAVVDAGNDFLEGEIDIMIIIAPNGVHRNWIVNEIPAHLPLKEEEYISGYWESNSNKAQKAMRESMLKPNEKFKVFAMNAEALSTEKGETFFTTLLKNHNCFVVIDEANQIMKNPKAKRTKVLLKTGKIVSKVVRGTSPLKRKRVLTGTPVTQGPFDIYAPFRWLSFSILGYSTFSGFKSEFGIFITQVFRGKKPFQQLTGYKNLEKLKRLIEPHSFRVLKKDCLDLPEKMYEKVYVEMTAYQKKVYNELRDEFIVELQNKFDETGTIEAPLALTRILRLQQIVGGFVPFVNEENEKISMTAFEVNPKLNKAKEIIDALPNNEFIIIWCRFVQEIKALEEIYSGECVTYYGEVDNAGKAYAVEAFQDTGEKRIFIANQQCAGLGLTLTRASTVIYYSNSFSFADRLQSEDRCHRIGQKNKVTYIDLITPDTVDEKIIKALKGKKSMADSITGDEVREWL